MESELTPEQYTALALECFQSNVLTDPEKLVADAAFRLGQQSAQAQLDAIRAALGTEETGENLVHVARAAHVAEQELAAKERDHVLIDAETLEGMREVVHAAKWANWCPEAGGYREGRSIEDCYENLHAALCAHFRVSPDAIQVPNIEWMSEEELDAALAQEGKP